MITVWKRDRGSVDHDANENHLIYEAGRQCRHKNLELLSTLHIMNLSVSREDRQMTDRQ